MISIPERLKSPRSAINPNGCLNSKSPMVTPIMDSGTVSHIIRGCLTELKRNMTMSTIKAKNTGILF